MYEKDENDGCFWTWHDAAHTSGESIPGVIDAEHYVYDPRRWGLSPHREPNPRRRQPIPDRPESPPPKSKSKTKTETETKTTGPVRRRSSASSCRISPYSRPPSPTTPRILRSRTPTIPTLHPTATRLLRARRNGEFSRRTCLECGSAVGASPSTCDETCYLRFHEQHLQPVKSLLDIRPAGSMGNGVYLKEGNTIPTGTILGLYLGEIMPYDDEAVRGSRYVYQLFSKDRPHRWNDVAIDAAVHGNWTRFVNSHCEPNVRATVEMVGGVLFVTFTAARELEGGGQLFVSYGPGYFWGENGEGTCECGWKEGKHLPPSFNGSE